MPISRYIPTSAIAKPGVCTSSTRPASPYEGQYIYETDTDKTLVWNGSAWIIIANATGVGSNVRLGYQTRTTSYTPGANIAAAGDIFSSDITWAADGTSTYWVEFYCNFVYTGAVTNSSVTLYLVDGSGNDLGRAALIGPAHTNARVYGTMYVKIPYTPASGSRSINFRGIYGTSADALFSAGAGGAGAEMPMWCAVTSPVLA